MRHLIVAKAIAMLQDGMAPDFTIAVGTQRGHIVIDDYRRLPGRFFGRFTTAGLLA